MSSLAEIFHQRVKQGVIDPYYSFKNGTDTTTFLEFIKYLNSPQITDVIKSEDLKSLLTQLNNAQLGLDIQSLIVLLDNQKRLIFSYMTEPEFRRKFEEQMDLFRVYLARSFVVFSDSQKGIIAEIKQDEGLFYNLEWEIKEGSYVQFTWEYARFMASEVNSTVNM